MKNKIILLGGGGHARVLIDLIRADGKYEIIGILDSQIEIDTLVSGVPVIGNDNLLDGNDNLLDELYKKGVNKACIGVGSVRDNNRRKALYEKAKQYNFSLPFLIHPGAIVSENAQISEGVQIMGGAIIQTGSLIGENTIINTGSIIEHDCSIGRHVHICPGAIVSGGCTIGDSAFIGAGSTLKQGMSIGKDAVVGAGSVVVRDVSDGAKVMGVPAKSVNE